MMNVILLGNKQYRPVIGTETPFRRVPLLVLDLDSTVRKGFDELGRFVNKAEDVEVFPEAVIMMKRWKETEHFPGQERPGRIVGVSNQGGIALGHVSMDDVCVAMIETQRQCEFAFDKISFCQHHPQAADPEMARCWCRKPSAGAVVEAVYGLAEKFPDEVYPPHLGLFVGDREEDRLCAKSANFDFIWAEEWRARAR